MGIYGNQGGVSLSNELLTLCIVHSSNSYGFCPGIATNSKDEKRETTSRLSCWAMTVLYMGICMGISGNQGGVAT